jgi:hypothetical protein
MSRFVDGHHQPWSTPSMSLGPGHAFVSRTLGWKGSTVTSEGDAETPRAEDSALVSGAVA